MDSNKLTVVTGSAGFIGFSLCVKLLERGDSIIGIDNHNDYYDPKIKEARHDILIKYSMTGLLMHLEILLVVLEQHIAVFCPQEELIIFFIRNHCNRLSSVFKKKN